MEGFSASFYKGFKGYWRRNKYERLHGSGGTRRKNRIELATLGSNRRKPFWRIRIKPKLRFFKSCSPKKLLIRLRDAYVNMMLGFANSRVFNTGFGGVDSFSVGSGFGKTPFKEYDEKVIIQLYKSLMAQGDLVARDAGGISASAIACSCFHRHQT